MPSVMCSNSWRNTGGALVILCEWYSLMKASQDIVMKVEDLSNGFLRRTSRKARGSRLIAENGKVCLLVWSAGCW